MVALWLRYIVQVIVDLLNLSHFRRFVIEHRSCSAASLCLIQTISIILNWHDSPRSPSTGKPHSLALMLFLLIGHSCLTFSAEWSEGPTDVLVICGTWLCLVPHFGWEYGPRCLSIELVQPLLDLLVGFVHYLIVLTWACLVFKNFLKFFSKGLMDAHSTFGLRRLEVSYLNWIALGQSYICDSAWLRRRIRPCEQVGARCNQLSLNTILSLRGIVFVDINSGRSLLQIMGAVIWNVIATVYHLLGLILYNIKLFIIWKTKSRGLNCFPSRCYLCVRRRSLNGWLYPAV